MAVQSSVPMKASDILIALTSIDPTTVISSNARVSDVVLAIQTLTAQVTSLQLSYLLSQEAVTACDGDLATCQAALLACQGA